MSTTNLFVELLVTGTGAASWLSLIALSATGYQWVTKLDPQSMLAASALIPVLTLVYVLGIVIDRFADCLFERYAVQICEKCYVQSDQSLYDDRRLVLSEDTPSTELLLYGRSRARIVRGWVLNSALIAIFLNVFLVSRMRSHNLYWPLTIYGTTVFIALSCGCWFSWTALKKSEYVKTREQAEFLRRK